MTSSPSPVLTPSHPQDLYDIARAVENTSWQVRKEAVDKLLVRINDDRGFNTRERKIVLQLFDTLLTDNHAKILGAVGTQMRKYHMP